VMMLEEGLRELERRGEASCCIREQVLECRVGVWV
jgi:hypothetical protein